MCVIFLFSWYIHALFYIIRCGVISYWLKKPASTDVFFNYISRLVYLENNTFSKFPANENSGKFNEKNSFKLCKMSINL